MSYTDLPAPVRVRAEATADNTSIRVSWEWSCQGVLDLVRVHYQPEGGSLTMYTLAIQQWPVPPCLTCSAAQNVPSGFMLEVVRWIQQVFQEWFLYQQEVCTLYLFIMFFFFSVYTIYHPSPSHSHWGHCWGQECLKCQSSMAVD